MVQITIGSNVKKQRVNTTVNATPAQLLTENNVSMTGASVFLNGVVLSPADFGKSLGELGVQDETSAMLIAAVKAESAA